MIEMDDLETVVKELQNDVTHLTAKVEELIKDVAVFKAQYRLAELIIKWAVFPLIIILGALVGVKLAWPGA